MLGRTAIKYQPSRGLPRVSALVRSGGVQNAQASAAAAFFRPAARSVEVGWGQPCGSPGMPPCDSGDPVSALQGLGALGLFNTLGCSSFDDAVATLGQALERAKAQGLTNDPRVKQAQDTYDNETSALPWKRSAVWPTNCAEKTGGIAALIAGVNSALKDNPVIVPPSVTNASIEANRPPPEPVTPKDTLGTIKTVAIVGGVIAGVVLLAPIVWEGVAWAKAARRKKGK